MTRIPNSLVGFVLFGIVVLSSVSCSDSAKCSVDIPEGPAVKTLKEFAKQANVEIVFKAPSLVEIRTNAVSGLMTPETALRVMLAGTALAFDVDSETGAYAVTLKGSMDTADKIDLQSLFSTDRNSVTLVVNSNYKTKNINSF